MTQDLLESIVAELPETLPGAARRAMGIDGAGRRFDTVLEGRSSYEVGLAAGVTNAYPHLRHLVFSTTMQESPDPTVELVAADPAQTARGLKGETASTSGWSAAAGSPTPAWPRSTA